MKGEFRVYQRNKILLIIDWEQLTEYSVKNNYVVYVQCLLKESIFDYTPNVKHNIL